MKKFLIITAVAVVVTISTSFIYIKENVEKLTMEMTMRELKGGKSYTVKASIGYIENGSLISHFTEPLNYYLITSNNGIYQIYNPKENSVTKGINPIFGSNQTQLHYFLKSGQNDLGLKDIGFSLSSSKIENGLLIKEYKPTMQKSGGINSIELVHEKDKPIFMGAKDEKGNYIRKTYYYNYLKVGNKNFPSTITEITYNAPGDSSISKLSYSDIRINEAADKELLNFKVPQNATVTN